MTTTDLAVAGPGTLADRLRYAEALAAAQLLPPGLRKRPADVLVLTEYGLALGLSPIVAVQSLAIVEGKVVIPAQLAATLARRAGHRLRVESTPDRATATLTRHDDPDYTFTATWDMERAMAAGLAGRGAWPKFQAQMLAARATLEVVRMGAPEALAGLYAVEEVTDTATWTVEPVEPHQAHQGGEPATSAPATGNVRSDLSPPGGNLQALAAALTAAGHTTPAQQRTETARILGRPIATARDLTAADVARVRDHLAATATGRLAVAGIQVADPAAAAPDRWDHANPHATRADLRPSDKQAGMLRRLAADLVLDDEQLEQVAAEAGVVRPITDWTRRDASAVIDQLLARQRAEYPRRADRSDHSDPGPWQVPDDDTAAAAYLQAVTAAWQHPDADGRPAGSP